MTDTEIWKSIKARFKEVIAAYDEETGKTSPSVIIEPNRPDTRDGNDIWFQIFPLTSQPHQQELGSTGRNRWTFGLQIDINSPSDLGTGDIDDAYDFIAKHFKRGDIFDGIRVLQTAFRSSARVYDDYYSVPVTVMVQADLDN